MTTCTPIPRPALPFTNTPPPHSQPIAHAPPPNSTPITRYVTDDIIAPIISPLPPPTPTNSGIASQSRADITSTTTLSSTLLMIPTVTQLSQVSLRPSGSDALQATIRQRQLPGLPTFLQPPGSALCCSILL